MYQDYQELAPQIIETASATTSPDNANSGSRAYIITAVALLVFIILCTSICSCSAAAFKSVYYLMEDDMLATDWEQYLQEDPWMDTYGYDLQIGQPPR